MSGAGSAALASAIHRESGEREDRFRTAMKPTTLNPLPIARACPELQHAGTSGRYPAAGRDPCPFCATRGDLGCAHFAPATRIESVR